MKSDVKDLIGKNIFNIFRGPDELIFYCSDGDAFKMHHDQDCCETVEIEDISGELEWLIGSPILVAEERSNHDNAKPHDEYSCTWTFYEIATLKGDVTIRWYGTSNGYYSEKVDFERIQ